MNDDKLLEILNKWLEESKLNQEGLKEENKGFLWPEWNKGYHECLQDLIKIINAYPNKEES